MSDAFAKRKAYFETLTALIAAAGGDCGKLKASLEPIAAEAAAIGKLKAGVSPQDKAADDAAEKHVFKTLMLKFTTDSCGGDTGAIDRVLDGLAGVDAP